MIKLYSKNNCGLMHYTIDYSTAIKTNTLEDAVRESAAAIGLKIFYMWCSSVCCLISSSNDD